LTPEPTVLVHRTPDELAEAVCARLVTALVDAQSAGRVPRVVLTGGSIADRIHAAVAGSPARDAVDWSRVELWWGDERFLPSGDPDRNETQARKALIDHLRVDDARVHPMAASDSVGDDPDRAADLYASELAAAAEPQDHGDVPAFDIVMLGVGPDGHVASLFPGKESLDAGGLVVAEHDSPKPPPVRLSLTYDALNTAQEIWIVAAGAEKALAVRSRLTGALPSEIPAVGVHGRDRTVLWVDEAAYPGVSQ
jgi:6-phosphogluconolactonase